MKQILPLLLVLAACAAKPNAPTIRGSDLYVHVAELRASGRAVIPSSKQPLTVRLDQYLVDRSRGQIFVVEQVTAGCDGQDATTDEDCTLALLGDQRFSVENSPPARPEPRGDDDDDDLSPLNKARLIVFAAGAALTIGALKCDAFADCKTLMGIGAVADGLVLLLLFTGLN